MKIQTTIYLLIIAIIIFGYILVFEKYHPTNKELERRQAKPFTIALEKVQKITINNSSSEKIIISKDKEGDGFSIVYPRHVEGDPDKIEEIIRRLETVKSIRTVIRNKEIPLNINEFGLYKPRVEMDILTDNKSINLRIGKKTPLGENMYVMLDKDTTSIYLLPNNLIDVLDKTFNDLRNKKVTRFDIDKIYKLEIHYPEYGENNIIYIKKENGWYLPDPYIYRANEDNIYFILNKLKDLEIVKFADNDPYLLTSYGLGEKDRIEITAYETRRQFRKVLFGKIYNQDELWGYTKANDKNYIYISNHSILNYVPKKVEEWRDYKILRFKKDKINKLKIEYKDKKITLAKQDGTWYITEPVNMPADADIINNTLQKLSLIETEKFVSEKAEDISKYGLTEPTGKISLYYLKQQESVTEPPELKEITLLIGNNTIVKDKLYLKNNTESTIFILTLGILDSIFQDYIYYKDRTIWNIPEKLIKGIDITISGKINKIELSKGNQWMMGERMVDPLKITDLITQLSSPKAYKYITLDIDQPAKYGLVNPQITVTFMFGDISLPDKKLLIGNKAKLNTYYAQIDGQKEVFTISNNIYNLLTQEY